MISRQYIHHMQPLVRLSRDFPDNYDLQEWLNTAEEFPIGVLHHVMQWYLRRRILPHRVLILSSPGVPLGETAQITVRQALFRAACFRCSHQIRSGTGVHALTFQAAVGGATSHLAREHGHYTIGEDTVLEGPDYVAMVVASYVHRRDIVLPAMRLRLEEAARRRGRGRGREDAQGQGERGPGRGRNPGRRRGRGRGRLPGAE